MYFVTEITESSLDLALSVLCRMIIPLRRLDFSDDKEVMCLCYRLWIEAPTYKHWAPSEGASATRWTTHLDGCSVWKGRAEGSQEADICVTVLV